MKSTLLLIFLLFWSATLQAQYPKEVADQIKAVENSLAGRIKIEGKPDYNILDRMAYHDIKGLSIAVVHDYKVVWAKGYGWADEEEHRPVTPETLFEPGSISKSLNAVAILKLVQDRKLDLHTDINTYLTSWKFPYDSIAAGKKITLAQLLSHSAGLTVHGFAGYDLDASLPTVPQILDGLPPANSPPVRSFTAPGTETRYSGGGTTISQLILTDVTKQPYDVFLYNQVLKPMGMVHSFYTQPAPEGKRALCATGYHADGSRVHNRFHAYPEQAAAGLWMTPTDLCQYIIETQLAWEGRSAKVLNTAMTRLRLTPYNDSVAALGVFVENRNGTKYFEHGAGNDGFCGQYYGSLQGGNGVAVFMNSDNPALLSEVVNAVAQVYKWPGFYQPVHRKVVAVPDSTLRQYTGVYLYDGDWSIIVRKDSLYYLVTDDLYSEMHFSSPTQFFNEEFLADKEFITAADGSVTGYRRTAGSKELSFAHRITNPDTLHLDKDQLNEIGWFLLEGKDPITAARYLRRGLELYPGDLLTLGNLAHSYLFTGRYPEAIAIYKAHLPEQITNDFSWQDMIRQDFVTLKKAGYSKDLMLRVFTDISIRKPAGF